MVSRLTQIQSMLEDVWGGALQEAAPDLVYQINRILVRFGRTDDTLPALWDQLDSLLFNTVYQVSGREKTASGSWQTACSRSSTGTGRPIRSWRTRCSIWRAPVPTPPCVNSSAAIRWKGTNGKPFCAWYY